MKDIFPEFYRPTKKEFQELWDECLFTFDTCILLDLYRYSESTRNDFLKTIKTEKIFRDLWLTHQVAFEYQKNRLNVIYKQEESYKTIIENLNKKLEGIKRDFDSNKSHPTIDFSKVYTKLENVFKDVIKEIEEKKDKHPSWTYEEDGLRDKISDMFREKIGKSFDPKRMGEIKTEAKIRYENKTPPGYADKDRIGDLILWFQIINKAKETKKPIIFVTNDKKEDWWDINKKGETIGPRYELIKEIREEAHVSFYMYNLEGFLKFAKEYIEISIDEESINEIRLLQADKSFTLEELAAKVVEDSKTINEYLKELRRNETLLESLASINFPKIGDTYANLGNVAMKTLNRTIGQAHEIFTNNPMWEKHLLDYQESLKNIANISAEMQTTKKTEGPNDVSDDEDDNI